MKEPKYNSSVTTDDFLQKVLIIGKIIIFELRSKVLTLKNTQISLAFSSLISFADIIIYVFLWKISGKFVPLQRKCAATRRNGNTPKSSAEVELKQKR